MSPGDLRAARVLVTLVVLGGLVRWQGPRGTPPGGVAYAFVNGERPVQDSVIRQAERLSRPLARGEKLDINRAGFRELTRLPGIGPALATRIVSYRDEYGPFASQEELKRVSGLGDVLVERISPHLGLPATPSPRRGAVRSNRVSLNHGTLADLSGLPGIGPSRGAAIIEFRKTHGPLKSVTDLTRIRGIGPAIVAGLAGRVEIP